MLSKTKSVINFFRIKNLNLEFNGIPFPTFRFYVGAYWRVVLVLDELF